MDSVRPVTQIRQWLREEIAGEDEVLLPELARTCAEHFAEDRTFVLSFFETHLYPVVYELAQKVMSETRGPHEIIVAGDTLTDRERFKKKARSSKWDKWLEHVGDRHMRLSEMCRPELLVAAQERKSLAAPHLKLARLWEALAERLPDDETPVGSLFTADKIAILDQQMEALSEEKEAA